MVIDIELTLNRFGFGKIADNKFQLFCFRFSKWNILGKYSVSFEINWRADDSKPNLIEKQAQEKSAHLQKILELFDSQEKITNDDAQKLLGVSEATAVRYFDELEKQGAVRQVGETGKYVFYSKI